MKYTNQVMLELEIPKAALMFIEAITKMKGQEAVEFFAVQSTIYFGNLNDLSSFLKSFPDDGDDGINFIIEEEG